MKKLSLRCIPVATNEFGLVNLEIGNGWRCSKQVMKPADTSILKHSACLQKLGFQRCIARD